jgi:integrase
MTLFFPYPIRIRSVSAVPWFRSTRPGTFLVNISLEVLSRCVLHSVLGETGIMQIHSIDSSKYLSFEEEAALQSRLDSELTRDTLMLSLLLIYGMRANELLSLRKMDLRLNAKSIFIFGSKGSRDREFPLSDSLFYRLAAEAESCTGEEEKIFKIRYNRLGDIWRAFRPCKKKLHSLRHTCAIRIFRKEKDIKLVQKILGHVHLTSTLVYSDFCYTQEQFRRVLVG